MIVYFFYLIQASTFKNYSFCFNPLHPDIEWFKNWGGYESLLSKTKLIHFLFNSLYLQKCPFKNQHKIFLAEKLKKGYSNTYKAYILLGDEISFSN